MAAAVEELHVVPPSDLDTDDDEACAELAELFGEEVEDTPPPSPPPVEQKENVPSRPSILERLLAKDGAQLSNGVAGIVRDARAAIDNNTSELEVATATQASRSEPQAGAATRGGVSLTEVVRKRRRRQGVSVGADGAARKKARNTFAVLGRAPSVASTKHAFDDPEWTGMRLRDSPHSAAQFAALFEAFTVVGIAELADKAVEIRSGAIRDPLVFGALVKKAGKRTDKSGGRYAVWVMSNMPLQAQTVVGGRRKPPPPLTTINCLLFGDAFERHHTAPEGTVFALRAPALLPPRDGGGAAKGGNKHHAQSGWCMSVRGGDQLVALAHAADFGLCAAEKPGGATCGEWFHRGYSSRCHYHTRALLKRHTSTARMVINNAVRPGAATRAAFRPATAPVNVSDQPANAGLVDRYASAEHRPDEVQLARARKDDAAKRRILAERDRRKMTDIRTRVRGNERSALARLRPNARPKTPHDRMLSAMRTLTAMGWELAKDGTLTPPAPNRSALVGVDVAACVNALTARTRPTARVAPAVAKPNSGDPSKDGDGKRNDASDGKDVPNATSDKGASNEAGDNGASNDGATRKGISLAASNMGVSKDTSDVKDECKARGDSAYAKLSASMTSKKETDGKLPPLLNAHPPKAQQVKPPLPVAAGEQGDIELSDSSDDE